MFSRFCGVFFLLFACSVPAQQRLGLIDSGSFSVDSFRQDVTGNGFADCAVGVPSFPLGGMVHIADFSDAANNGVIIQSIFPQVPGALFGWDVACDMDLTGDSIHDLVVGAPGYASGDGGVAVYAMSPNAAPQLRWFRAGAVSEQSNLGYSVAFMPDVNEDGVPEVVAGAPSITNSSAGSVHVLDGASGAVLMSQTFSSQCGFSIASGPGCDFNGDGNADFVTGDPVNGEVWMVDGASMNAVASYITSATAGRVGHAVEYYIGQDSLADVAAGCPASGPGMVLLIEGQGGDIATITSAGANNATAQFGFSIARIPDPVSMDESLAIGCPTGTLQGSNFSGFVERWSAGPSPQLGLVTQSIWAGDLQGYDVANGLEMLPAANSSILATAPTFRVGMTALY